jgi:hypothetical protein
MSASGLLRTFSCLMIFGWGAQALGGGGVGVILSAIVALAANHLWRQGQQQRHIREHREYVIADEELRLHVREQQAKP